MRTRHQDIHLHPKLGVLALVVVALMLAVAGPASASAAPISAHLKAPNHSPLAGKLWWITVTVERGHQKLSGSVKYEFVYDGTVVSTQAGHSFKGGVYRDSLLFPKDAVGHPLTLRIVVSTKYGTVDLNWAVEARA